MKSEKVRAYARGLNACATEKDESLIIIYRDKEKTVLTVNGEAENIATSVATALKKNPFLIEYIKIAVMMAESALEKQKILENNNSQ